MKNSNIYSEDSFKKFQGFSECFMLVLEQSTNVLQIAIHFSENVADTGTTL